MMTLALSAEQRMYQIMKTSYEMKRDLTGKPECKLEYQIASRIHLNAFCYLVNKGLMPAECEENGRIALSLTVEGITHVCAAKSVKSVIKADFEPVEKAIQGLKERMAQEERLEREAQRSKKTAQHAATGTAQAALIRPQTVRTEGPAVDIGAVFREAQDIKQRTSVQTAPVATVWNARISNDTVITPVSENPGQPKTHEKEPAKQDPEPAIQAEERNKKEEAEKSIAGPATKLEQPEAREGTQEPEETYTMAGAGRKAEATEARKPESEDLTSAAVKKSREEMPEDFELEAKTEKPDDPDEELSEESRQTGSEEKIEEVKEQADVARETIPTQGKGSDEEKSWQAAMEASAESQPDTVLSVESPSEQQESESAQEPETGLMPESENESVPTVELEPEATSKQKPEVTPEPEAEENLTQGPEPESEAAPMTEPDKITGSELNADAYEEPDAKEADDVQAPEDQVQEEKSASTPEEKKHHFTAREPEPVTEEPAPIPIEKPDMEVRQPAHNKKKGGIGGIFGRFMPKNSTQEPAQEQDTPEAAKQPATLYDIREESEFSNDTPGITLCHMHLIKLKKTFGNAVSDPYVFYIWPTEVIEMYPERMPTSIFVYAKSPYGTIVQRVSDLKMKYVTITMDGKQFTIFGSWQNGRFETEVALINKTASVYSKIEVIRQNDPDIAEDAMLDPFRSAKENRKPEYFIVPLYGTNRGQNNVPIAAFARVNDKNYVIEAAGKEENSLLVSAANVTSEITGRWEDGTFHYEIHQLDQF